MIPKEPRAPIFTPTAKRPGDMIVTSRAVVEFDRARRYQEDLRHADD